MWLQNLQLLVGIYFCTLFTVSKSKTTKPVVVSTKKLQNKYASVFDDEVCPYWEDLEGRPLPPLPKINHAVFRKNPPCRSIEQNPCSSNEQYRRIDGFCNNLDNPKAGTPGDLFQRLLEPLYDNGVFKTKSRAGGLLKNPRLISNAMKRMSPRLHTGDVNVFWLFFGQFIDHDLSLTPFVSDPENELQPVPCDKCNSWKSSHACAPILVPSEDGHIPSKLSNGRRHCIRFTRSAAQPSLYGSTPALEQMNFNTAYLDLSVVYGSNSCIEKKIRLYNAGEIIEVHHPYSALGLPPFETKENFGDCRAKFGKCYRTGDVRSNEQLGILSFHALFLREHNRLARALRELNPQWTDEKTFQEARKINIAQYQRIVYEEFLRIMLGDAEFKKLSLYPKPDDNRLNNELYDSTASAQIFNEFATAAFRVGHTMVPDHIITADEYFKPITSFSISQIFMNSTRFFEPSMVDELNRGMMRTRIEGVDPRIEDTLSNKLAMRGDNKFTSEDLLSINIARGRDHALAGYIRYRSLCSGEQIYLWEHLQFTEGDLVLLKGLYSSVDDIDLFVGGLIEEPLDGAVVGPTFACIIAQQFLLSRKGDKYWYENSFNGFSIEQLREIKKGSPLARILAFDMEGFPSYIPFNPFNLPDRLRNPLFSTTYVEDINLEPWRESYVFTLKSCIFKGVPYPPGALVPISECLGCYCDGKTGKVSCINDYGRCLSNWDPQNEACKMLCGTN